MVTSQGPSLKPHALVVPVSAQGHIYPMFELAAQLFSAGFVITFVHSKRYQANLLQRTKDRIAAVESDASLHDHADFRMIAVPDGMPEHNRRPPGSSFAESRFAMERGVREILEVMRKTGVSVTCLIADTFFPKLQDVANEFKIPKVDFSTLSTVPYSILLHLPLIISRGYLPIPGKTEARLTKLQDSLITCIPGVPSLRVSELMRQLLVEDLSDRTFQAFFQSFLRVREAYCVLGNTFYELERDAIDALRADSIPFLPVGPLLPPSFIGCNDRVDAGVVPENGSKETNDTTLQWLDKQGPSSVIYVSFGTFEVLPNVAIRELALGLAASQQPFLWVLRLESPDLPLADILPEGFFSRTQDRGLVVSWAPQLSVLSHPAVGGFLTHCGWNSTLESLSAGVPILGWPFNVEQPLNLKMIVEKWKVGLALERDDAGMVGMEGVEKGVRKLMEEKEGHEIRKAAAELRGRARRATLRAGSSRANLELFVEDMKRRAQEGGAILPAPVSPTLLQVSPSHGQLS